MQVGTAEVSPGRVLVHVVTPRYVAAVPQPARIHLGSKGLGSTHVGSGGPVAPLDLASPGLGAQLLGWNEGPGVAACSELAEDPVPQAELLLSHPVHEVMGNQVGVAGCRVHAEVTMLAAEHGHGRPPLPRPLESHLHAGQRSRPLPSVSTGYRAAQQKQTTDGPRALCRTFVFSHPNLPLLYGNSRREDAGVANAGLAGTVRGDCQSSLFLKDVV